MYHKKEKPDLNWTLKRVFGKAQFRPLQRQVINTALEGHDVFLQAATSFGKSLCFQLPAVVDHGSVYSLDAVTVVVSPLLALMRNQVSALQSAGIDAASINSTTSSSERKRILSDLECGHPMIKLLYVTPEYCALDSFRRVLHKVHEQCELSRVAIDEAHCISEWGHDFRPSFKQLDYFRRELPTVPIMCLTATATPKVREDIIRTLGLVPPDGDNQRLKIFTMTSRRRNLHYEIRYKSDEHDHLEDFVSWLSSIHTRRKERVLLSENGDRAAIVSGIIYTLFRRDCEILAERLRERDIGAKPYHAGLSTSEREECLQKWIHSEQGYDIIVATTAFGMGIDKNDVRFVVHWQVPKSFEGFYQEAGRAGRDSKAAACIVYYSREDRDRSYSLIGRDNRQKTSKNEVLQRARSFQALVDYCEATTQCRHDLISRYFGDANASIASSQNGPACDYACDFHKEGSTALQSRKRKGLSDEDWLLTQRQNGKLFDEVEAEWG